MDPGAIDALLQARHGDPFAVLGPHRIDGQRVVRTLQPGAQAVEAIDAQGHVLAALAPVDDGLFAGVVPGEGGYRLRVRWATAMQELDDPYAFGALLAERDLDLLAQGQHPQVYRQLGAHPQVLDGVPGVRFAVWAPNARRVSVVGDFNQWDGRRHPMRLRLPQGVWELFVPGLQAGARYKYEILGADFVVRQKADPVALATEPPPATASVVAAD
ncbi:MAG: 1,4-alpha-glucan branching enzyme, partial [Frateuria sp.]|nr:1,4-alpha-glucan branching enzyme [Frateuria sp.]